MFEQKKTQKEIIALSLIVTFSFAVALTGSFFTILLVKRWCMVRRTSSCTQSKHKTKVKLNTDNNDEKFIISYQLKTNKPDILNKGNAIFFTLPLSFMAIQSTSSILPIRVYLHTHTHNIYIRMCIYVYNAYNIRSHFPFPLFFSFIRSFTFAIPIFYATIVIPHTRQQTFSVYVA